MSTSLVTGANRGIGLALCEQLAARGDHVIAVCREGSPELAALDVEIVDGVDVAVPATVRALPARLGDRRIDLLINNAGVGRWRSDDLLSDDTLEEVLLQFRVNGIGPVIVTQALLPLLAEGARVGIVTSRMGSIADNTSGGTYGYRMSKAAVNAAGKSLALDLAERGIAVALLHPGYVRTDMTSGRGDVEAATAAAGLIARLDALTPANSGGFWHANGDALPW
jgi:NAD(P)-dependent dehydrogenase (short-subunit alcohol dehydrogenase family)